MTSNKRLYLDIHAIQTLPPSNINRDDTGSPKTALYGGVRRARVSSQAWKRAIRKYFNDFGEQSNVGIRTLRIVRYVADKIQEEDPAISDKEAMDLAEKTLNAAKISTKDQKAKALFFMGDLQAKNLAKAAIEGISDKQALQAILKSNPAVDIALFGRMVADDPSLNEDASSQVAHAISTHGVDTEFDFYTAMDDLSEEDSAGAGMLGTIEFNSSTLYRYANVSLHEFIRQVGNVESAALSMELFAEAFANSLPTGKINSYANTTLPQLLLIVLREDRPVNLVSAFEKPVKDGEGYVEETMKRLGKELENTQRFVREPLAKLYVTTEELSEVLQGEFGQDCHSLENLKGQLGTILKEAMVNLREDA